MTETNSEQITGTIAIGTIAITVQHQDNGHESIASYRVKGLDDSSNSFSLYT